MLIETERLLLRQFTPEDAAFALELLSEPGFLHFIGDKGVRDLDSARKYLERGPIDSYHRNGFGLLAVCLHGARDEPLGMCGLVRRDGLLEPDLGYAFLRRQWGRGYAIESAAAVVDHAARMLALPRLLAITAPGNARSIRVLEKIGFKFERFMRLPNEDNEVKLFGRAAPESHVSARSVSEYP